MEEFYEDGHDIVYDKNSDIFWSCGIVSVGKDKCRSVVSKTSDGGETWTRDTLSVSNFFESQAITVDPSDPKRVFDIAFINNKVTLFVTENAGNSWDTVIAEGISGEPKAIVVSPTNKNMLAAGTTDGFYVSLDNGNSWTKKASYLTGVYDLVPSQSKDGLLIGSSNDGVYLWEKWAGNPSRLHSNSSGDNNIKAMVETPEGRIYAGTKSTAVWINDNTSGIIDNSKIGNAENQEFLYQVHNKSGNIEIGMDIIQDGHYSMELFDLSGKLLKEFFSQYLIRGKHTFDFDSSNLANGMYIVKLKGELYTVSSRVFVLR